MLSRWFVPIFLSFVLVTSSNLSSASPNLCSTLMGQWVSRVSLERFVASTVSSVPPELQERAQQEILRIIDEIENSLDASTRKIFQQQKQSIELRHSYGNKVFESMQGLSFQHWGYVRNNTTILPEVALRRELMYHPAGGLVLVHELSHLSRMLYNLDPVENSKLIQQRLFQPGFLVNEERLALATEYEFTRRTWDLTTLNQRIDQLRTAVSTSLAKELKRWKVLQDDGELYFEHLEKAFESGQVVGPEVDSLIALWTDLSFIKQSQWALTMDKNDYIERMIKEADVEDLERQLLQQKSGDHSTK